MNGNDTRTGDAQMTATDTTAPVASKLYRLVEWEENRYDDSDGMLAVWDDAAGTARADLIWSTRFASTGTPVAYLDPTPEVLDRAVAWLAGVIFDRIRGGEHLDVMEPQPAAMVNGRAVRLLVDVDFADKRNGGAVVSAKAGEAGTVCWSGSFGKFYRGGYNKPGRGNTRVGVRFADGRVVFTKLDNLRLDREVMGDDELRARAVALAENCCFKEAVSTFGGWETINYARPVRSAAKVAA